MEMSSSAGPVADVYRESVESLQSACREGHGSSLDKIVLWLQGHAHVGGSVESGGGDPQAGGGPVDTSARGARSRFEAPILANTLSLLGEDDMQTLAETISLNELQTLPTLHEFQADSVLTAVEGKQPNPSAYSVTTTIGELISKSITASERNDANADFCDQRLFALMCAADSGNDIDHNTQTTQLRKASAQLCAKRTTFETLLELPKSDRLSDLESKDLASHLGGEVDALTEQQAMHIAKFVVEFHNTDDANNKKKGRHTV